MGMKFHALQATAQQSFTRLLLEVRTKLFSLPTSDLEDPSISRH